MASRRYPTAELYEERERDFYRNGRSERDYDELDMELRRGGDARRSAPDFFREDRRPPAGPLVVRREEESFTAKGPRHAHTFNDETRSVRSRGGPASSVRDFERDDITIRRSDGERRRPREVDMEETDVVIRRREQSRPRTEMRETERDDIIFRRGEGATGRSRGHDSDHDDVRFLERDRDTVRIQERDGKFEVRAKSRHRDFSRERRELSRERTSLTIRERERSLPPPRRGELIAREREEFVIRRPRDESPPQPREIIKDEIIIRRKEERMPTPSPSPSPPPPPPAPVLEPEIRPPIIQEIITHHRHIDHGVVRARSPTPPPPPRTPTPPPPPTREKIEIEINRMDTHRGRGREEYDELDIDINLRDRSRGRGEYEVKSKRRDMWTEVTKDLVIKEAIDQMGYSCEETDDHFYVMEYLRYEDVLQLVEISDTIRSKRKSRIREIEIERKEIRERPRSNYDDRYYEHDVTYDRRGSRYR